MNRSQTRKPSILDILLSLMVDPRGTTDRLFRGPYAPPWVLTTLLLFLCLCVAPSVVYVAPQANEPIPLDKVSAVVLGTILTMVGSTFFMVMGLRSLNIRRNPYEVFAALIYATAPISTLMVVALGLNRILEGDLTLIGFLVNGFAAYDDLLVKLFPHLIHTALFVSFIALAQCLRALTHSSLAVASLMAMACIPFILGAFIVGLTAAELLFPASSAETIGVFQALLQV